MSGKLFLVATPIGNLSDFSNRAVETLNFVDIILCEDTRHSTKLLKAYNIEKPLESYHKFNAKSKLETILQLLRQNKNLALITDAGTPAISDPGAQLIKALIEHHLPYTIIPGASASISAFALSGLEGGFTFVGFLPDKKKSQEELLKELLNYKTALIFYSAPHNLQKEIEVLYRFLGDRKLVIVRELTKIHEEVFHTTLKEGYPKTPRGEFVLVVEGKSSNSELVQNTWSLEEHLDYYVKLGYTKNEGIKQIASDRGLSRQEVYKEIIKK